MAEARTPGRLNPTLFDKLVADNEITGLRGSEIESLEHRRDTMGFYSVTNLERFNESALRATVRRELAWLLNTTNLGAVVDLAPYPHVQTSVLNYGVPDFAGKHMDGRVILQRARDIRHAVRTFEPRMDPDSVTVEASDRTERENAITYLINGDVVSAVRAIPVKFRTDVELDTAAATVRE